jgi:hypothetical protein
VSRVTFAVLLLLFCCGCPAHKEQPDTAQSNMVGDQAAPAVATGDADTETQSQPAVAGQEPATSAPLELLGIHLGMSAAEFEASCPAGSGYSAKVTWLSTNDVAMGLIKPDAGGDEAREASFTGGTVVMYTVTDKLDQAKFRGWVEQLTQAYGAPQTDPPDFAAGHAFFKDFQQDRANFLGVSFWVDEPARTLISATMWPAKDKMYLVLFNPDRYDLLAQRQMKTAPPQPAQ